jgi:glycosyltransferase involved in cell wall biosynthesis
MALGVFTDDFYPHKGGMGRYVYEVTRRLPQEQILIFSPSRNHLPRHVCIHPPFHRRLHNVSLSLWLIRNIRRMVSDRRLTRVNVHCGPGGVFLLSPPGVPVLATSHHTYWQQARFVPLQWWKRLFIPFEARTYRIADKIVAVSEDTRSVLVDRYRIASEKVVVIPNGVDRQRFHPLAHVERMPGSLLYVGRVDKRKGIDFLIESIPLVLKRNPRVKLYVGGTGPHLGACKQLVKMHRLEGHVEFLGRIPEEKLNEWYNRAVCLVVPSRFEGFGLTVVEAMAAGTSVVATRVDGLRALIRDGVNGYLVDYGSREELSGRIASVLEDPEIQRTFSQKGREMVAGRYDWDVVASRISAELDRLGG